MEDFELIEYLVFVTYDDYSRKKFVVKPNENIRSLDDVKEHITPEILSLENGDSKYFVSIKEVYKINNEDYKKFNSLPTNYFDEAPYYDFSVITGEEIDFDIDTPDQKIPVKYKLVEELNGLGFIDCNGRVVYDNVAKGIDILTRLSEVR